MRIPFLFLALVVCFFGSSPQGRAAGEPHPNPPQTLGTAYSSWLDCRKFEGIAYFLFSYPNKVERYDLAQGFWLTPIPLPAAPQAFTVGPGGIYVSAGQQISVFSFDGKFETPLGTNANSVGEMVESSGKLYLVNSTGSYFTVMDASSGTVLQSTSFTTGCIGLSASATANKLFASTQGGRGNPLQYTLDANGLILEQAGNPEYGVYSYPQRTTLFPGESRVVNSTGIVYSTTDFACVGSLAGTILDIDFAGDTTVVLREGQIFKYSSGLLETGRKTISSQARIFVSGSEVVSFAFVRGRGVTERKTALAELVPPTRGLPVDPTYKTYVPEAVEMGGDGVIYLLSNAHKSIFRWLATEGRYLTSIPLTAPPEGMAYAAEANCLYLSYGGGRITKVELSTGFPESEFVNTPITVGRMAAAGEYLFADNPNYAQTRHFVFSPAGNLISSEKRGRAGQEYLWSAGNRRLYFLATDTSANSLVWEEVGMDGKLGEMVEQPGGTQNNEVPLQVAPDGNEFVLGNGKVYRASAFELASNLGVNVKDATWADGKLFTFTGTAGNSAGEIRAWDADRQLLGTVPTGGQPLLLRAVSDGVVMVSQVNGRPRFAKYGFDLALRYINPTPVIPTLVTDAATDVRALFAQMNGTLSNGEFSDVHFEFGTTESYGSRASGAANLMGSKWSAYGGVYNLQPNTKYHYRLAVMGPNGPIYGADSTFTTLLNVTVNTQPASVISTSGARLNGTVTSGNGYTSASFEWGADTSYGHSVPGSVDSTANGFDLFSAELTDLPDATTYHFRAVVTYPEGVYRGPDQTFKTVRQPVRDFVFQVTQPVGVDFKFDLLELLRTPKGSLAGLSTPSLGNVYLDDGGLLHYLPRVSFRVFTGTDSMLYLVDDGEGGTVTGKLTFLNPFYQGRGTFAGTLGDKATLSATIAPGGTLSGRVKINGVTVSFTGAFGEGARFEKTLNHRTLGEVSIQLQLVETAGKYSLVGTVNGMAVSVPQPAALAATSRYAGSYTLMVPPDPDNETAAIPQGSGYAVMTVSTAGVAKISGQLADGRAFSAGGRLFADESGSAVVFNAKLAYAKAGRFAGTITFTDTPYSDCDGVFTWEKSAQKTGLYAAGFNTTSLVTGGRYAAPVFGFPALALDYDRWNARFRAGEGNLEADIYEDLTISYGSAVVEKTPDACKLRLTLNPRSGMLTGSFLHPVTKKAVNFRGITLAKFNIAAGYFLGPSESGFVALYPPDLDEE